MELASMLNTILIAVNFVAAAASVYFAIQSARGYAMIRKARDTERR